MRPEGRDLASLWDMLDAARNIRDFVVGFDAERFYRDKRTHFAVISQIEILGEATKRLSDAFRDAHPDIPWRRIAAMRDVLIHAYDQIDLKRVWEVATVSVAELTVYIEPLLPPNKQSDSSP